jgi:hypothetical protein
LVSDELIVCKLDAAQQACLQPGTPQILLWKNSFEQLILDYSQAKPTRVRNQFLLSAAEKFAAGAIPVRAIIDLQQVTNKSAQREILGRTKFTQILQRIYLPRFPRPTVISTEQTQMPMTLASQASMETISWSAQEDHAEDLLNKILERYK